MDPSANNPFGNFGPNSQGASVPQSPIASPGQGDISLSPAPATKKPKKWLWTSIAVLAVCIVAAIIITLSSQSSDDPYPLGNISTEEYQELSEESTSYLLAFQQIPIFIENGIDGNFSVADFFNTDTITGIANSIEVINNLGTTLDDLSRKVFPRDISNKINNLKSNYLEKTSSTIEGLNSMIILLSAYANAEHSVIKEIANQINLSTTHTEALLSYSADYIKLKPALESGALYLSCTQNKSELACEEATELLSQYDSKYSESYDLVVAIFSAIFSDDDITNLNIIKDNLSEIIILIGDRVWLQN